MQFKTVADVSKQGVRFLFSPALREQTRFNLSLDVLSSKIVPGGSQGFYLEALRSLAVCKLCVSVLHSSWWSQSEGFKHDLAFQMICVSTGASQGSGDSPGCVSHHYIK